MKSGLGNSLFLVLMLGASGLTMLRMILLSGLLEPIDFALYATIIATGTFFSPILSFGAVEHTVKSFPRLAEDGRLDALNWHAWQTFKRLLQRAAIGLPLVVLGYAIDSTWLVYAGLTLLYALGTATTSLLASMQRALNHPVRLVSGTILRTATVFVCVVGFARMASVPQIVGIEIIATLLASVLSWVLFFRQYSRSDAREQDKAAPRRRDGILIFLAYSAVAAPFYLDRLFVTAVLGGQSAAQYAVLALFLTAASLLVNTVAQRVGPTAVRLAHRDGDGHRAFRQVGRAVILISILWLGLMAAAAGAFAFLELPHAIARYRIEPEMLIPITLSGILLNSALLEFLLIALDREREFVASALTFLAVTLIGAAIFAIAGGRLVTLIWILTGCRAIYVAGLIYTLRSPVKSVSAKQ